MEEEHEMSGLRTSRRKKSSGGGLSGCFGGGTGTHHHHHQRRRSMDLAGVGWFKSKPKSNDTAPGGKGGCSSSFISRITHHRRYASADQFTYDPLSYALNFENDATPSSSSELDHVPPNFTSRLPVSPPRSRTHGPDHHLPRTPLPEAADHQTMPTSTSKSTASDDLRRGFEALSVRMKKEPRAPADQLAPSSSPRAHEEVTSPGAISSNRRGVLVQLC